MNHAGWEVEVSVSEPTTLITNTVLAALAVFWGIRLWWHGRQSLQVSRMVWAGAFVAVAVGAVAGGAVHGLAAKLGPAGVTAGWKVTVLSVGLASFCLLAGALLASFGGTLRQFFLALAALKLTLYTFWMIGHDDFKYVINDYGSAMLMVLLLEVFAWWRYRAASAPWILGGIAISFLAAGIQQSGLGVHRYFNHNDLYHVVQMAGLYLLYRGGRRLRDRAA
jgi:hypothetical protein